MIDRWILDSIVRFQEADAPWESAAGQPGVAVWHLPRIVPPDSGFGADPWGQLEQVLLSLISTRGTRCQAAA